MTNVTEYVLDDGKYKLVRTGGYMLKCFRNGEPWRDDDLIGDNLIHALLNKIDDYEQQIEDAYYEARERDERS